MVSAQKKGGGRFITLTNHRQRAFVPLLPEVTLMSTYFYKVCSQPQNLHVCQPLGIHAPVYETGRSLLLREMVISAWRCL